MFWTKAKRTALAATVVVVAVFWGSVSAIGAEEGVKDGSKKTDPKQEASIKDLIEKLASENHQEREAAFNELRTLGEAALPMLKATLARTKDAEQRNRCQQLANGIITTEDRRKINETANLFLDRYAEDQRDKIKALLAPGVARENGLPDGIKPVGSKEKKDEIRKLAETLKDRRYCRWQAANAEWKQLPVSPDYDDVLIILMEDKRPAGAKRYFAMYFVLRRQGETWKILAAGDCRIPATKPGMIPEKKLP